MNMTQLVESIICQYYRNNKTILFLVILVILTTGIGLVINGINIEDVKCKAKMNLIYSLFAVTVGKAFCLIEGLREITYEYFNVMIFAILSILIILYANYQYLNCADVQSVFKESCSKFRYVILFELFMLVISAHLSILEYVTALLAIILCDIFQQDIISESKDDAVSTESDYPTDQLFPTRERQLNKFIPVLKEQGNEPYAIMISGEWGTGKTSFMKALEKQMSDEAYFIYVEAGAEKSVSQIMDGICNQIVDILHQNNICVKNGEIEQYFKAFAITSNDIAKSFSKILDVFVKKEEQNTKDFLNSKLQKLEKTIYIVIDDLDRCDNDYQSRMFKVIRESLDLNRCKTMFLIDEKHFLNEKDVTGDSYLRKYISYNLELCKVNYEEIVNELFDEILKEDMLLGCENFGLKDIRKQIFEFHDKVIQDSAKIIENLEQKRDAAKEEERKSICEKIGECNRTIRIINGETANVRSVKKYLKEIKRDINNLVADLNKNGTLLEKEINEFVSVIIGVQYIKWFIPEKYVNIKTRETINGYYDKIVNAVLGIKQDSYTSAKEEDIERIDYVLFHIEVEDFPQIVTRQERLLSELRDPQKRNKEKVFEYLECAQIYDDMLIILKLLNAQNNINEYKAIISTIFDDIKRIIRWGNWSNQEILEFSMQLNLRNCQWSEREKNTYQNKSVGIANEILRQNFWRISDILVMVYDVDKVTRPSIDGIKNVYDYLQQLSGMKNENVTEPQDLVCAIEEEMERLKGKLTLSGKQIDELHINLEEMFSEISIVLKIYRTWLKIGENFSDEKIENNSIVKLIEDGILKENDIVKEPVKVEKVLKSLKEEFEKGELKYETYVNILEGIAKALAQIDEQTAQKYNKSNIRNLMIDSIKKCDDIEKQDELIKRQIEEIKVYLYRFGGKTMEQ